MRKRKIDELQTNTEELGMLEKEFKFFKDYYNYYCRISNGDLKINEELYRELFNSSNYWDYMDNFKDVFNSEYHYFMDKIFQEYINV